METETFITLFTKRATVPHSEPRESCLHSHITFPRFILVLPSTLPYLLHPCALQVLPIPSSFEFDRLIQNLKRDTAGSGYKLHLKKKFQFLWSIPCITVQLPQFQPTDAHNCHLIQYREYLLYIHALLQCNV